MSPTQLKTFIKIVKLESISKAAIYLNVSQSTVSQRLKSIEDEYNIRLLKRNKGTNIVSLTTEGEAFYKIALRWKELINEAQDIKKYNTENELVIGVVDSVSNYIFPEIYKRLLKKHPNMKLVIRTHQSNEIYSLLRNKEIDIGFPLTDRVSSSFIKDKLFEENMKLIMKRQFNFHTNLIKNNQLNIKNEIFINRGSEFQEWHNKYWSFLGVQPLQTDTIQTLLNMMESHHWAIVPESVAKALEKQNNYYILPLENEPPSRTCYYVRNKNNYKTQILDSILHEFFMF